MPDHIAPHEGLSKLMVDYIYTHFNLEHSSVGGIIVNIGVTLSYPCCDIDL